MYLIFDNGDYICSSDMSLKYTHDIPWGVVEETRTIIIKEFKGGRERDIFCLSLINGCCIN
jgi:hypothetical protein